MIRTFSDAELLLPALRFDLGQSTSQIKELFNAGLYLMYSDVVHGFVWCS